jgi:MFS family permease
VTGAGTLVLTSVHGALPLVGGRALQGIGCGLASSAVAAFIVDNAPASRPALASAVTTGSPMVGLTLGALGSGALAEYGPAPRTLIYLICVATLAVCALLVLASRETIVRVPGAAQALQPRIRVRRSARRLLPSAAATFLATWALGGFYQALGPTVTAEQLGTHNALVAALVVILISLGAGIVATFIAASVVAGLAQGTTFAASMRALLANAGPADRAGILATIYLISYSGAAIPGLIAGQLARSVSLFDIALGYGGLAAVGCAITVLAAREPKPQAGRVAQAVAA